MPLLSGTVCRGRGKVTSNQIDYFPHFDSHCVVIVFASSVKYLPNFNRLLLTGPKFAQKASYKSVQRQLVIFGILNYHNHYFIKNRRTSKKTSDD